MKSRIKKLVLTALFAALTCVATMIVKIPSPFKGYINIGDCVVLLCGWMLTPLYGFAAAGIGSSLADLLSGYAIYAPATFLIKGIMAWIVCMTQRAFRKKDKLLIGRVLGAITAELFMAAGYYLFESMIYGFAASLPNIPANLVQGAAGLVLGVLLLKAFDKSKLI